MNDIVFALDIGTQSVSGILLENKENQFSVIDYYTEQHEERTMLDGQIQDVVKVAKVIEKVKSKLEKKHGALQEVCVAAAGRALKTVKTKKTMSIADQPITSEEAVHYLELSAVQQAQVELVKTNNQQFSNYHCVGFSVLHYYLDGERIGSLVDQSGIEAGVEIITTFLPKVVIESLLAALERAGLHMKALTLEPIAAIHVLVPESMRRLNVVLIDIGAGTSDIAIASDGTVTAYGMVPVAGDEITEAISDEYLLDFKEAEHAKQQVVYEEKTKVRDILGFETEITHNALSAHIADRTEQLTQLLSEEILKLNTNAPQAVMLIGGGSMTPNLADKLATNLHLPKNRVAIRGVDGISLLDKENQHMLPHGPDFVTPIGIAISATENPLHYTNVYVNDRLTLMFRTKELTVGDCLVQAGININKYYGKIGLSHIVEVNGNTLTLRGGYGEAPVLYLNEQKTTVDQPIQAEDTITIVKGIDGNEPHVSIRDVVGEQEMNLSFTFEGIEETLQPVYHVNGIEMDIDYTMQDKDKITSHIPTTIGEFLDIKYPYVLKQRNDFFTVTVDQQEVNIEQGNLQYFLNGFKASTSSRIKNGDDLTKENPAPVSVDILMQTLNKALLHTIKVTFNGTAVILSQKQTTLYRGEKELSETAEIYDGDVLTTKEVSIRPFIFQDVFRHIDIELAKQGSYELTINDSPAGFHDHIQFGDQLALYWN